ncbi:MAG: hypothetical protein MO852_11890, partial [Candidatus Devosia euplotis]|nr:hypothetical protein [Candidatus Devosia euplotis]
MKIDRCITNGLAWAGVVLVIGVPVADAVSAQLMGDRLPAAQIATIAPTEITPPPTGVVRIVLAPATRPAAAATATAEAKPAAPAVVATAAKIGDVVDGYLKSGKALPSYITDAGSAPQTPVGSRPDSAAAVTVPVVVNPIEVVALGSGKVAPVP